MKAHPIFTEAFRAEVMAALELNGGLVKPTARQMGIAPASVRNIRLAKGGLIPHLPPEKRDFGELFAVALQKTLTQIIEKIPGAKFKELAIWAGIAADKHLDYSQGRVKGQGDVNIAVPVQFVFPEKPRV